MIWIMIPIGCILIENLITTVITNYYLNCWCLYYNSKGTKQWVKFKNLNVEYDIKVFRIL